MGVAIVAIPSKIDRVWRISSQKIPHMTLIYLGDALKKEDYQQVEEWIEHVADTVLTRFDMGVEKRGTLGDQDADVLFFRNREKSDISILRTYLLQNPIIREAYESIEQFEPWTPHLTLGYPDSPAKLDDHDQDSEIYWVGFDHLMFWVGEFEGPQFELKDSDMSVAMDNLDETAAFLEHFGVKGMKWGIRKEDRGHGLTMFMIKNGATKDDAGAVSRGFARFAGTARVGVAGVNARYKNVDLTKDPVALKKYEAEIKGVMQRGLKQGVKNTLLSAGVVASIVTLNPAPGTAVATGLGLTDFGVRLYRTAKNVQEGIRTYRGPVMAHSLGDEFIIPIIFTRDAFGLVTDIRLDGIADESTELTQSDMNETEDFLAHFGVEGMKWGVRRSLDERRAARTQKTIDKAARSVAKSEQEKARADAKTAAQKAKTDAANARLATKVARAEAKTARSNAAKGVVGDTNRESIKLRDSAAKEIRTLDDQTLKAYSQRIDTEKKLKSAIKEDKAPHKSAAAKLISEAGKDVAKTALVGAGSMAVYYLIARAGASKGRNPMPKINFQGAAANATKGKANTKDAFDFAEQAAQAASNTRVPFNKYPNAIPTSGRPKN